MFDILRVILTNFKSYRGTHTFYLPVAVGLYSLTGRNEVNPYLEANAAGKSTLLDSIYWCFYGRTSRGLKAGDVVTWGESTCSVSVDANIAGQHLTTTRTQNPNNLTLLDKVVSQEQLQKHLRLGPEAFGYAVMLPQFGNSFFDLAPTAKLNLFSEIMELDYWLDKSKIASEAVAVIECKQRDEEQNISFCQGALEACEAGIEDLKVKERDFNRDQAEIITGLEAQLREAGRLTKKLTTEEQIVKQALVQLEEKLMRIASKIKLGRQQAIVLMQEAQEATSKYGVAKRETEYLLESLDSITDLEGKCPTCLQQISEKHLQAEVELLSIRINEAKAEEASLKHLSLEAILRARGKDSEISALEVDQAAIQRNSNDFATELARTQLKVGENNTRQSLLKAEIVKETGRENPYSKMLKAKFAERKKLLDEEAVASAKALKLAEEHTAISYWVTGFRRVRLFLIEETLQKLELEVNNALASLGLMDWRVEFAIERENKAGGITKGFTVQVHAPDCDTPVRLEAWSGGETQRLRLAGNLGLANLIMERAGLTGTIEFYDEPSRHMTTGGLMDLADALHYRAHNSHKRIFLVDHHLLDCTFDGTFVAVKDSSGSRLEAA